MFIYTLLFGKNEKNKVFMLYTKIPLDFRKKVTNFQTYGFLVDVTCKYMNGRIWLRICVKIFKVRQIIMHLPSM